MGRYFIDTEFVETGADKNPTIDLISIGIVAQDGRELYLINSECNLDRASDWVQENVLAKMPEFDKETNSFKPDTNVFTKKEIANKVLEFVGDDKVPEFWAYFCSYDWCVFCWLFGTMMDLPEHFPKICLDLKQEMIRLGEGNFKKLPDPAGEHNALVDAIWLRDQYNEIFGKPEKDKVVGESLEFLDPYLL